MSNNQPIKEFKAGGIKAAIWKHEHDEQGRTVVRHSVRITKSYRDRQTGEWKETDYFYANDLPRLRLVTDKAYEFVALKESEEETDQPTVAS